MQYRIIRHGQRSETTSAVEFLRGNTPTDQFNADFETILRSQRDRITFRGDYAETSAVVLSPEYDALGEPVLDDLLHRAHLHSVFLAHHFEIRKPRHVAVRLHDLDDRRGGMQPGETTEVDRTLGLAGSNQNATLPSSKRIDVSGTDQIIRASRRVGQQLDRGRSIGGADPGGHTMPWMSIDADGEGRLPQTRVDGALRPELAFLAFDHVLLVLQDRQRQDLVELDGKPRSARGRRRLEDRSSAAGLCGKKKAWQLGSSCPADSCGLL